MDSEATGVLARRVSHAPGYHRPRRTGTAGLVRVESGLTSLDRRHLVPRHWRRPPVHGGERRTDPAHALVDGDRLSRRRHRPGPDRQQPVSPQSAGTIRGARSRDRDCSAGLTVRGRAQARRARRASHLVAAVSARDPVYDPDRRNDGLRRGLAPRPAARRGGAPRRGTGADRPGACVGSAGKKCRRRRPAAVLADR